MTEPATHKAAKKNGLILLGIIAAMITGTLLWVIPEGLRIRRDRDRRLAEARTGTGMAWPGALPAW